MTTRDNSTQAREGESDARLKFSIRLGMVLIFAFGVGKLLAALASIGVLT